jgi:GT2 family glycosyltransferase
LPFNRDREWPPISVVVCTYNGARIIRDCLKGLASLDYPNYEVIVVNDGSTDNTATIVQEYGFRLITTENQGLSSARNTGMEAATGEIIAYTDDDARPDRDWLTYLAATFMDRDYVAVGGPNIAPPDDGLIAQCVSNSPGGPIHILLSDTEAEHIPGCNLAVRKVSLRAIGGFDPVYRVAGDDVDVCWRLRDRGWKLGFSPSAMVWHHRRNSVRAYWKQQKGYGKAEALLEKKWPEKYNAVGHLNWSGRLYGNGFPKSLTMRRRRIFHGVWGNAPFQSVYQPAPDKISYWILMPESLLVAIGLAGLSMLGVFWQPLLFALPFAALIIVGLLTQAVLTASRACTARPRADQILSIKARCLVSLLTLIQPVARLRGRMGSGLVFWRRHNGSGFRFPAIRAFTLWNELWRPPDAWLSLVQAAAKERGAVTLAGGDYDCWDLEVRTGIHGGARMIMAIEEHGSGRQLIRFRCWPKCAAQGLVLLGLSSLISTGAWLSEALTIGIAFGSVSLLLLLRTVRDCGEAMATFGRVIQDLNLEGTYFYKSTEHLTRARESDLLPTSEPETAFVNVRQSPVEDGGLIAP